MDDTTTGHDPCCVGSTETRTVGVPDFAGTKEKLYGRRTLRRIWVRGVDPTLGDTRHSRGNRYGTKDGFPDLQRTHESDTQVRKVVPK